MGKRKALFLLPSPITHHPYRGIVMSKKRLLLSLAALAALVLTAADASVVAQRPDRPELTEEFHQTYQLAAGGRVSLSNINGAVKVVVWERDEVKVDAVKRAYTAERLREAQIKVDASPNRVRIETDYPDSTLRWSDRDVERHENPASVEYTLTVPRRVNVDERAPSKPPRSTAA
jgi:hypothetical protein